MIAFFSGCLLDCVWVTLKWCVGGHVVSAVENALPVYDSKAVSLSYINIYSASLFFCFDLNIRKSLRSDWYQSGWDVRQDCSYFLKNYYSPIIWPGKLVLISYLIYSVI